MRPRTRRARVALLGGENARTALGRLAAPAVLPLEHVHGIARREGGERGEPGIGEAAQRLETGDVAHHGRHLPRLERPSASHTRRSSADRCAGGARSGLRKANCVAWSGRRASSAIARSCASAAGKRCASRLSGIALRGPTRSRCCRSKCTSLSPPRPLVRTSTASTMVRQAADQRALGADHRTAAGDDRDIGGGAAHVGDHEVLEAGEKSSPDDARRRTRQDGLDRILERHLGLHQRAVALDDHQRRIDRLLDQHVRRAPR